MVPDDMTEVGSHEADIVLVKKGCHKHSDSSVYCLNHAMAIRLFRRRFLIITSSSF